MEMVQESVAASTAAGSALAQIQAGLQEFLNTDLTTASNPDILQLTSTVEQLSRRLHAASVTLIAQIEHRGLATPAGQSSTSVLLRQILNIGVGDAAARVAAAAATCPRPSLNGQHTPAPALPAVNAALRNGTLGAAHTRIIISTLNAFPATVDETTKTICEQFLVEQGTICDPVTLSRIARHIALMADPDGTLDERQAHHKMQFHIGRRDHNGLTRVWGRLDDLTTEALRQALNALTAPTTNAHPPHNPPKPAKNKPTPTLTQMPTPTPTLT